MNSIPMLRGLLTTVFLVPLWLNTACPPTTVLSIYNSLPCPKQPNLAPLTDHK